MSQSARHILIIDDEQKIQESISITLKDYGFKITNCTEPLKCFELVNDNSFDLVLLDIWMPDIDGIQILKRLKQQKPNLPVMVISGHVNLANNFELAKLGASEFLEKPFSSDVLVHRVNKILNFFPNINNSIPSFQSKINSLLQPTQVYQKTIKKSTVVKGKGLHSGTNTGIILSPAPVDSGVLFEDISSGTVLSAQLENVISTSYSTNLKFNDFSLSVVEHLLAAFHIYGVNNVSVKVNNEIPILDGSAIQFCELLEESGLEIQNKKKKELCIDKIYTYTDTEDPSKTISIEPFDGLCVDYLFELPKFGEQQFKGDFSNNNVEVFKQEIAPARTFGFMGELKGLQSAGLGQGGDMSNFLLVDENRVLNQDLRFEDEFVRHKVLDILGDLMLIGYEVRGKITGRKTGHRHNIRLIKTILSEN